MGKEACVNGTSEETHRFRAVHGHAGEEKTERYCSQVASEKSMTRLIGSSIEEHYRVNPILDFVLGGRLSGSVLNE